MIIIIIITSIHILRKFYQNQNQHQTIGCRIVQRVGIRAIVLVTVAVIILVAAAILAAQAFRIAFQIALVAMDRQAQIVDHRLVPVMKILISVVDEKWPVQLKRLDLAENLINWVKPILLL